MPEKKPLSIEWSKRAEHDLTQIEYHYFEEVGEQLAEAAGDAVYWQVQRIALNRLFFREGKADTRECVIPCLATIYRFIHRLAGALLRCK